MENTYSEAFTEVLEVIEHSTKEIREKIPKKFIDFLNEYKDEKYVVEIDFSKENWEEYIKDETQAILALVYRDYIVSKEKRQILLKEEKEEQIKKENELNEKYNPDNLFENKHKNVSNDEELTNTIAMVEYKESFFVRLFKKIKSIFIK